MGVSRPVVNSIFLGCVVQSLAPTLPLTVKFRWIRGIKSQLSSAADPAILQNTASRAKSVPEHSHMAAARSKIVAAAAAGFLSTRACFNSFFPPRLILGGWLLLEYYNPWMWVYSEAGDKGWKYFDEILQKEWMRILSHLKYIGENVSLSIKLFCLLV